MSEKTLAERISFIADDHIMEVDFSNMTFNTPEKVNGFYDEVERQLKETGKQWFFLVNYHGCEIMTEAWIAFAHRGKKVNIAYSLGSVRYDAGGKTGEIILDKSRAEKFDPNLFASREEAVEHINELRAKIPGDEFEARLVPNLSGDHRSFEDRVSFHEELSTMEADFSNFTFATSADVNGFYDVMNTKLEETGRKWFFIVNYSNTQIHPEAWYQWSRRGKELNAAHSLGTVRFNPAQTAKEELIRRGRADEFDPKLVASRDEALSQISEMQQTSSTA